MTNHPKRWTKNDPKWVKILNKSQESYDQPSKKVDQK